MHRNEWMLFFIQIVVGFLRSNASTIRNGKAYFMSLQLLFEYHSYLCLFTYRVGSLEKGYASIFTQTATVCSWGHLGLPHS